MQLKRAILELLPHTMQEPARNLYRRLRWGHLSNEEIFGRIYSRGLWGAQQNSPYSSGDGSEDLLARPYVHEVARRLSEHGVASVVDVGCGDFRVGRALVEALPGISYIGVDIVRELVEFNRSHHAGPRVSFQRLDVTRDSLPAADACLVRQVFQHLSNAQIDAALDRMRQYRCLVITESHPVELTLPPNIDKTPGPSVRHQGWHGSGVYPTEPPFRLPMTRILTVRRDDSHFPEVLTTYFMARATAASGEDGAF